MGGDIGAASEVGEGTRFTLEVPMKVASGYAEEKTLLPDWSLVADSGLKILVVEDNGPSALVVTTLLDTLGCQYRCVIDGCQAVKLFSEEVFDVVLMDIEMPVMDGLEACTRIRQIERGEHRKAAYILVITAHAHTGIHEDCMSAGMNALLAKPISVAALQRHLCECVSEG